MTHPYITLLGKAVRQIARLRGGGSALPGLFIEKIDPDFIARTLSTVPRGVVLISGTNGKTTTTKMTVELLESQGLKVFTNRTGSNFTRGVAAALLGDVDMNGELHADIAVLELDEAHAVHFVNRIKPRYSLLLNVMRDQLDRFGEIDTTARLLETIALHTGGTVVLNREDSRIRAIADSITEASIAYFGLEQDTRSLFPNDDELHGSSRQSSLPTEPAIVTLTSLQGQKATFHFHHQDITASLQLSGIYNIYNTAAALALVDVIMGSDLNLERLIPTLEHITPAFGRGETLLVGGQPLELILVKNPGGFRLGLSSFQPEGYATMIAINDNYADGRDMSWLWDVDFDSLSAQGVSEVTGIRAYDMALRLQYDLVEVRDVNPSIFQALQHFLTSEATKPKRIFCTYTAMLAIRRELSKITTVETIS